MRFFIKMIIVANNLKREQRNEKITKKKKITKTAKNTKNTKK